MIELTDAFGYIFLINPSFIGLAEVDIDSGACEGVLHKSKITTCSGKCIQVRESLVEIQVKTCILLSCGGDK